MKQLLVPLVVSVVCLVPAPFSVANPVAETTATSLQEIEIKPVRSRPASVEFVSTELALQLQPLTPDQPARSGDAMEEIVVTAPRNEPSGIFRQRLSRLIKTKSDRLDWELLPAVDHGQLQAVEERFIHAPRLGNQFEPTGGAVLFRVSPDRKDR